MPEIYVNKAYIAGKNIAAFNNISPDHMVADFCHVHFSPWLGETSETKISETRQRLVYRVFVCFHIELFSKPKVFNMRNYRQKDRHFLFEISESIYPNFFL